MTVAKRLAALESKLIPQPDTHTPVDMRSCIAGLQIAIIGWHYGRPRKNESDLTRFARALRVSPETLFKLAYRDRKDFERGCCRSCRRDPPSLPMTWQRKSSKNF